MDEVTFELFAPKGVTFTERTANGMVGKWMDVKGGERLKITAAVCKSPGVISVSAAGRALSVIRGDTTARLSIARGGEPDVA